MYSRNGGGKGAGVRYVPILHESVRQSDGAALHIPVGWTCAHGSPLMLRDGEYTHDCTECADTCTDQTERGTEGRAAVIDYSVVVFFYAPPSIEVFDSVPLAEQSMAVTWQNCSTKPSVEWNSMYQANIRMNNTVVGEIMLRPIHTTAIHF